MKLLHWRDISTNISGFSNDFNDVFGGETTLSDTYWYDGENLFRKWRLQHGFWPIFQSGGYDVIKTLIVDNFWTVHRRHIILYIFWISASSTIQLSWPKLNLKNFIFFSPKNLHFLWIFLALLARVVCLHWEIFEVS